MSDIPRMTLSFLEGRPQAAAQVLEGLDAADAAAFLEDVPGRVAAPVMERMAVLPAAARLALLSPEGAAGVLREMSYPHASAMLRTLDRQQIDTTLGQLPARLREDFNRSLRYPAGSVGAWMTHRVAALPGERTAADALTYARQHAADIACHLFVVDSSNELAGAVSLAALLGAEPSQPLATMTGRRVSPLSSSAALASISRRPEWDAFPVMPVVGRGRRLVGSLSREMMRHGLQSERRPLSGGGGDSILVRLAGAWLVTCAGTLALAAGAPPASTLDREGIDARQRR